MELKRLVEVKLISIFAIILGVWTLFRGIRSEYYLLLNFSQIVGDFGRSTFVFGVFHLLILPVCFILGGIAFLLIKKWGSVLLLISLVVDILIRLVGILNFWYASSTINQTIVVPEGARLGTYSMIPSYMIVLAEIVALYFITRPKIKELFLR